MPADAWPATDQPSGASLNWTGTELREYRFVSRSTARNRGSGPTAGAETVKRYKFPFHRRGGGPYAFRLRFRRPSRAKLNWTENEVRLSEDEDVSLVSNQGLDKAEHIAIIGRGYPSEGEAWEAAKRWRGYVERGFARVNFPADFGDRAPVGGVTAYGLKAAEAGHGRRVLNDDYAMVFLEDPWPLFLRIGPLELTVGRTKSAILAAIDTAAKLDMQVPDHYALAYDLFSASFWQPSEDSRFMMLMMALETMIAAEPRSQATQAHIDKPRFPHAICRPSRERAQLDRRRTGFAEGGVDQSGRETPGLHAWRETLQRANSHAVLQRLLRGPKRTRTRPQPAPFGGRPGRNA
jgi:hypothetical protein